MRARVITSIEQLRAAVGLLDSAVPGRAMRTGRGEDYFARRFARERCLQIIIEDTTGIVGAALATLNKDTVLLADDFVAPSVDSCGTRALIVQAILQGAEALNASRLAVPAHWDTAMIYEELGFSSALFVQLYGPERERWRQWLIRDRLRDYRILEICSHGLDVAQAVFRLPRVDRDLLDHVERAVPACEGGSLFMMNKWVGPREAPAHDGSVTYRRPRYVVAHYPRFRTQALAEVAEVDPSAAVSSASEAARTIVAAGSPGCSLADAFKAKPPVFVEHMAPVRKRLPLCGDRSDLDRIARAVRGLDAFDPARSFAVQCRKAGSTAAGPHNSAPYTVKDVEVLVGSHLEADGFQADIEHPDQIVSVYLYGDNAFIGCSPVTENVSRHADEQRRRSRSAPAISRAQHKLEEAIDAFGIAISSGTRALDLGAAPGGWTKVLVDAGATVVAVDPGALSPVLAGCERVTHLKRRIEELAFPEGSFDMIVNDMSLDPVESAAFMCAVATSLKPTGPAVMTIKLPSLHVRRHVEESAAVLCCAYDVVEMRHLPHNRQELTAFLRRRETLSSGWEKHLVLRGAAWRASQSRSLSGPAPGKPGHTPSDLQEGQGICQ